MTHAVTIRALESSDGSAWLLLRPRLWPDHVLEDLKEEVETHFRAEGVWTLGSLSIPYAVFVAEDFHREIVGFVEVSMSPFAPGCRTAPVGYLEGWYVLPSRRRQGVGRALVRKAEFWARARGCTEMASDTWDDNHDSQRAHKSLGFAEVERVVQYRRDLL